MCGIAGIYAYGRREADIGEALLVRMRDTMVHRGPDGAGLHISDDRRLGLVHRRLSIVDPRAGKQPMFGANGEVLVFNGEIYNYPRLRRELDADGVEFHTNCDTEVILRLYERYGRECLAHLNGMFAFALWDPQRQELFLARDRLGEKPLYWTDIGGAIVFASEIKAILQHPAVHPQVNEEAIAPFLTNLVVPSPETLYKGIHKFVAGTSGTCDSGGLRTSPYYHLLESRETVSEPLDEAVRQVRTLLDRSVDDRLMSDVPVGVLLSGGVDSTTLVALMKERAKGLASFSVGFSDHPTIDERAEARAVAAHYGTDHHEVSISETDALGFLTELVYHQDEPLADPVCIPLYFVTKLAAQHGVKVVLAGEGADELFWGYGRYQQILGRERMMRAVVAAPALVRSALAKATPGNLHPQLRELMEGLARGRPLPMHMPLGFTRFHRERILANGRRDDAGWAPPAGTENGHDLMERLGWDTQEYEFGVRLPELLLMRIDRFSMANSVEARVPFLDPDLVDYAYRLPFEHKLNDGVTKLVLKRAVADIVPEWVLNRPKKGFGAPVVDWFDSDLGDVFRRALSADAMREYFDYEALEGGLRRPRVGRNRLTFSLWFVLNFALWHRYWIEGESLDDLVAPMLKAA